MKYEIEQLTKSLASLHGNILTTCHASEGNILVSIMFISTDKTFRMKVTPEQLRYIYDNDLSIEKYVEGADVNRTRISYILLNKLVNSKAVQAYSLALKSKSNRVQNN